MNAGEKTRLDRIEEKIDKLADAVVSIARAEEKIHSLEDKVVTVWSSVDDLHTKFDEIEERIRLLECQIEASKQTISNIVQFGWLVVGAIVTSAVAALFMLN
jgi:peptidoglycan hydrolase CwlO-like protein